MLKEVLKTFNKVLALGITGTVITVITFVFSNNVVYGLSVLVVFLAVILAICTLSAWEVGKKEKAAKELIEREHDRHPFYSDMDIFINRLSGVQPSFDSNTQFITVVRNLSSKRPLRRSSKIEAQSLGEKTNIEVKSVRKLTISEAERYGVGISKEVEVKLHSRPIVEVKDERGTWKTMDFWAEFAEPLNPGESTAFEYTIKVEKGSELVDRIFKVVRYPTGKLILIVQPPQDYSIDLVKNETVVRNETGAQEPTEIDRLKSDKCFPVVAPGGTQLTWEIKHPVVTFTYYLGYRISKLG